MTNRARKTASTRRNGFSLIEMMITVIISLVLLLGIIQLFINNKQGYALQQSANQLQERGRYATMLLGRSIRMADHWAGAEASAMSATSGLDQEIGGAVGSCTGDWVLNASMGIRGYDGAGTAPLACMDAGDYEPDTDMLVVRYTASGGVVPTLDLGAGNNANSIFARIRVGSRGLLFKGGDISADTDFPNDLREDDELVHSHPYRVELFFIRPCSIKAGTACSSTDDGGRPMPTLVRLTVEPGSSAPQIVQQALVEGIEQFQLSYGVDLDNDDTVDTFRTASAVETNGEWPQVISVRYGLVVRGDMVDKETLPTYNFQLPGGYTYTQTTTTMDGFQRKLFLDTIQIRNRTRG